MWPVGQLKQSWCKPDGVLFRGLWQADARNHSGRADFWTANVEFPFCNGAPNQAVWIFLGGQTL